MKSAPNSNAIKFAFGVAVGILSLINEWLELFEWLLLLALGGDTWMEDFRSVVASEGLVLISTAISDLPGG